MVKNEILATHVLSIFLFALMGSSSAAEYVLKSGWPPWDSQESVTEYAERVNLPPTRTLDLGNGVNLKLVLIPAGTFVMGTPEPMPVAEEGYSRRIIVGQALLASTGALVLVMLATVLLRAIRNRHRPRLSLGRLILLTVAAGGCVLSSLHWQRSAHALEVARAKFLLEKARYDSAGRLEKPAHPVSLTHPYYMGKFAVTQEQYLQVMGKNPSYFQGKDNPVETVKWNEAQEFCQRMSALTGNEIVRLPTEAEWEHACRAGTMTAYYSGDTEADLDRSGWWYGNSTAAGKHTTHAVGQKKTNRFELFDMHGNVWQWCQDWHGVDYYSNSLTENPEGPAQGLHHISRGGSWNSPSWFCRTSCRIRYSPVPAEIGFRIVVPVPNCR